MNNSLDLGVSPSAIFRAVPVSGNSSTITNDPFSTAHGTTNNAAGAGSQSHFSAVGDLPSGRSMHAYKKQSKLERNGTMAGIPPTASSLNTPPVPYNQGITQQQQQQQSAMQTNQSGSGMKVSGLTPDLQSMGMGVVPGFSSPSGANPFAFASPFKGIGMENSLVGFSPGQNYLPNMFYSSPQSLVHPSAHNKEPTRRLHLIMQVLLARVAETSLVCLQCLTSNSSSNNNNNQPLGSAGATVAGTTSSASKIPLTSTHSARTGEGSLALLSRGEAGTPQSEVGDSSFFGDLSPSVFASPKLGEVDLYSVHAPDTGLQPAAAIVAAVASTTASDDAAARLAMSEDDIARSPLRVGRDSSALQMLATASAEKGVKLV